MIFDGIKQKVYSTRALPPPSTNLVQAFKHKQSMPPLPFEEHVTTGIM